MSNTEENITININDTDSYELKLNEQGPQGFSPKASVSKSGSITTISITDSNGTTTAKVSDGNGVPTGGVTNQALIKHSSEDYDVEWGEAGAPAGSIIQIDLTGTLANNVLTFSPKVGEEYTLSNNTQYEFDLLFPASTITGDLDDTVEFVINDGTNTYHILNTLHDTTITNATYKDMCQYKKYDDNTGFRWVFIGHVGIADSIKTIYVNGIINLANSGKEVVQWITNAEMLSALTSPVYRGRKLSTGDRFCCIDNDGYEQSRIYKWTGTGWLDVSPTYNTVYSDINLSNITDTGKQVIKDNSGAGLEICDIGMTLYVDETKGLRRYLNGQLVAINTQTTPFLNRLKSIVALYPSLSTDETSWQATKTLSAYGQVGKFVINETAGTIRIPAIVNVQGLFDLANLGLTVSAGLPNITGVFNYYIAAASGDGAFKKTTFGNHNGAANGSGANQFSFDASRCSSIYGNSTTVQPESVQYPYFIQIATGQETKSDIINTLELNNPYTLFDSKYSENILYNSSWLRSQGQYNSGTVYVTAYEALQVEYNTAITVGTTSTLPSGSSYTKKGLSVKLSTETFTDYDYVLNTTDSTFRLPTKSGIVTDNSNLYLYYYIGETVQNASLINAGRIEETKANIDLGNISASTTAKNTIVSWGMPDYSAGVEVTREVWHTVSKDSFVYGGAVCQSGVVYYLYVKNSQGNDIPSPLTNTSGVLTQFQPNGAAGGVCSGVVPNGYSYKFAGGNSQQKAIEYPLKGVE